MYILIIIFAIIFIIIFINKNNLVLPIEDNYNILVLQIEDRTNNNLLNNMLEYNKNICDKNKIKYVFMSKTHKYNIPPYWAKVYELYDLMLLNKDIKYFIWLDSDAIFHNFNYNNFIKFLDTSFTNYQMLISNDYYKESELFNAGVFIVKNDDIGRHIMNHWCTLYDKDMWNFDNNKWEGKCKWADYCYEQGAFINNIIPLYKNNILILPYYVLNNISIINTHSDTLFIHLMGHFKNDINEIISFNKLLDNKN